MEDIPNINNINTSDTPLPKKTRSPREKLLLIISIILFVVCAGLIAYYFITKDPGTLLGPTPCPDCGYL